MSINQQSRKKTIAVIGVGKLGLCLALNLERAGYKVIGIDVSQDYCDRLNDKTLISPEPEVTELLAASKDFYATTDLSVIHNISRHPHQREAPPDTENTPSVPSVKGKISNVFEEPDVLFIAVATPTLSGQQAYDHAQVEDVLKQLIAAGAPAHRKFIYIVCTVMPGFTESADKTYRMKEHNYSLSYTPQFIAQGSIIRNQQYPDQLLVGEQDRESGDVYVGIMDRIIEGHPKVCRMSRISAELAKLATNCFLTMKIAFANAIGDLCTASEAEPEKVLECIGADSRINPACLKYGYGFGGPCFPRDNRALSAYAESKNYPIPLSRATDRCNEQHLSFQFDNLHNGRLNGMVPKEYRNGFVFDSVAYKPGSVIIEESQQLLLAVKLANAGHTVLIRDRAEVIDQVRNQFGELFQYEVK